MSQPHGPHHARKAPTLTCELRLGIVTAGETDYKFVDNRMPMLMLRELFRAQGFPDSYIIAHTYRVKPFSKTAQIRTCGSSVCPQAAKALVRASVPTAAIHLPPPDAPAAATR